MNTAENEGFRTFIKNNGVLFREGLGIIPREARFINFSGRRPDRGPTGAPDRSESRLKSSEKYIYIYTSMKVSVLLPGNSANTLYDVREREGC